MKEIYSHLLKTIIIIVLCFSSPYISAAVTITLSAVNGTCPATGTITVTAKGTSGTVFYSIKKETETEWSVQRPENVFYNLTTGVYRATVYDDSGATISTTTVALNNATPAAFSLGTPVSNNLNPTGCTDDASISLSAVGGLKPYTYKLADGPTSCDSVVTDKASTLARFLYLSTGTYTIHVTDGCGTTLSSNNIQATSKYNLSDKTLAIYDLGGTTAWDTASTTCGVSFTRSLANVFLVDADNDTLFRRSSRVEMPPFTPPVEGRVEYPAGSGQYTPWGTLTKYYLPETVYKPSVTQYKLQIKHPCNSSNIVTSTSTYNLSYPFNKRQTACGWEIYRVIKNFDCGNVEVLLVLATDPSQKYNFVWDGVGDSYELDLLPVPAGIYRMYITTSDDTYQLSDTKIEKGALLNVGMRADIYNYSRDRGCDFTTGAIRVTDVPTTNATPITYTIITGPATRTPVTSISNQILWDDLPPGTYQVKVDRGGCGQDISTVTLSLPYSGFDADTLSYISGFTCGKYKITGKGWYLAPNGTAFTGSTAYGVTIFDANTNALVGIASGSTASNSPFISAIDVPAGSYRLAFSSNSINASSCRYVERYITIAEDLNRLRFDMNRSGGLVCQNGLGELHIETIDGSGKAVSYRLKPKNSLDSDYTPYQFSPDFANLPAGEYTVQAYDSCSTITQNMTLVAGGTSARFSVSGVDIASGDVTEICPTNTVVLSLSITGRATDVKWKFPDGTELLADSVKFNSFSVANEGTYVASYGSSGCLWADSVTLRLKPSKPEFVFDNPDEVCSPNTINLTALPLVSGDTTGLSWNYWNNAYDTNITSVANTVMSPGDYHIVGVNTYGCSDTSTVKVAIFPELSTWIAKGETGNWNDAANWDRGIPGPCTNVLIAKQSAFDSGVIPHYPDLKPADASYIQASCDTITFEMGGEVAKTHLLNYNHAKVRLHITSNQWFMVAPPLRDMFSGDYFLNESIERKNPAVYIMKYQMKNPETLQQTVAGSWSSPFNTLTEELNPGNGFVIWVDKPSKINENTFFFPKDSTTYNYYYRGGGYWYTDPKNMSRTNAGRFAYEVGNWNGLQGSSTPPPTDSFGMFTLPVDGSNPTVIVGNPFMSHLNFEVFQAANNSLIENSYYIWSGGSFAANIATEWGHVSTDPTLITPSDSSMIAPMQSFIVMKKSGVLSFSELAFNFNTMSTTYPLTPVLRSSETNPVNQLNLFVERWGKRQSAITICYRDGENNGYDPKKDAWTLFNSSKNESETTVLYTLLDNKAASIRTLGDLTEPIELGLIANKGESLTLRTNGLENFDQEFNVFLLDKNTNDLVDLRRYEEYTLDNLQTNNQGRFFLIISKTLTGIEDLVTETVIKTHVHQGILHIESASSDPIQGVEVYNLQGQLMSRQTGINQAQYTTRLPDTGSVFIVKIQTLLNKKSRKVIQ